MSMLLMCAARPVSVTSNEIKVSAAEGMQIQSGSMKKSYFPEYDDTTTTADKKIIAGCFWDKCIHEKAYTFWVLKTDGRDEITECSLREGLVDYFINCGKDKIVDRIMKDDTNITEVRCTAVDYDTRKTTKVIRFPEHDSACFKEAKANEFWEKCKAADVRTINIEKPSVGYSMSWEFNCVNILGLSSFSWFSGCAKDEIVDAIMMPDTTGYRCQTNGICIKCERLTENNVEDCCPTT